MGGGEGGGGRGAGGTSRSMRFKKIFLKEKGSELREKT